MSELSLTDVSVSFGGPPLLEHISLVVKRGERIGLLGRNGAGKSTLLGLLSGSIAPSSGLIAKRQGVRVASLVQNVPRELEGNARDLVHDALKPLNLATWENEKRVDLVLTALKLDSSAPVRSMSAGMKRRALLAAALAQEPDVLLLDEPTNHLDLEIIEALEELLLRRAGALVFVTHDRRFLQSLATRILDVDRGTVRSFDCDYRSYLERKEALLEAEARANKDFDKKLAKEEVWVRRGVKARLTRNEGRVRALEAMRAQRRARREIPGGVRAQVQEAERSGQLVIEVDGLRHAYEGGSPLIESFTTTISRGDRIGILGSNGCGKTTLLNLLLKKISPQHGKIRHGTRLELAHFDQLHSTLDETKTAQENICGKGNSVTINGKPRHIVGYLSDFLFSPEQVRGSIQNFSGGERNRLQLAKILTHPANLLILDEPTNDLDLETLGLLEDLLLEYQGTLIIVSHDREFLDNVVTSLIVFEGNGKLAEYVGGYNDWLNQRAKASTPKVEVTEKQPNKPRREIERKRKLSFQEKTELETLPSRIEKLEAEKHGLAETVSKPDFYKKPKPEIAATTKRLHEIEEQLRSAYARWEELEKLKDGGGGGN